MGFLKKKVIEHKMCILIFSTNLPGTFLTLRRIQRVIVVNVYRSPCKGGAVLSNFNENLNFSSDFRKINKYQI